VPSQAFYLNLPALSAEDGQTGAFWLGAAPAWSLDNTKWRGAVIYRSSDGVSFTDYAAITTAVGWAKAMTVLPLHDSWGVWDRDNVLAVQVQSPGLEFESRTELEVLDGANLLLVGQEIVQFADAEQLGPSTWRLSKLLRGRRGTEWAMSSHQVGEVVLVLDPAALARACTLDDSSEVWDLIPTMEFLIENTTDPNRISFLVTGVYKFRVGVRRSGSTDTITSADLSLRKDGVNA
jgi:hypothetical protein